MKFAALAGRLLFSLVFLISGLTLFSAADIGYAASQGVPLAGVLVPISGVLSILGGVSILIGYKTRIGAAMIIVFLVPVTLVFHHFWTVDDPGARSIQMVHGPGEFSLDSRSKTDSNDLRPGYVNKG